MRQHTALDRAIFGLDQALRTVFGPPASTQRSNPGDRHDEADMSNDERLRSMRLMRVDHTGEVCAQALYQGQAMVARDEVVKEKLEQAAREEGDHLVWTNQRIDELGGHTSVFNPLFYAGSFAIGAAAGLAGDRWSLGFVVETEHQVTRHLDEHLERISPEDEKSRSILEQMREDELEHATNALEGGGAPLPAPIKMAMKLTSKVMTNTTYWV